MRRFVYHNCARQDEADIVFIGVSDESGSHSPRSGARQGPDALRKASVERFRFVRKDGRHIVVPEQGSLSFRLFDAGNITQHHVAPFISLLQQRQFPVIVGGDHSITFDVLKGLGYHYPHLAIIYLDAHPDSVCAPTPYYGSVICDIYKLPHIAKGKIVEIGVRASEGEELQTLRKRHITPFTALDVHTKGVAAVCAALKKIIGSTPVYLSIDLDVLDPAFAPGVSTPAPFGLLPNDFLALVTYCAAHLHLVGCDVMELTPRYDIQQMTAALAVQTILEIVGVRKKD